jgi:hypothetical protein
MVQEVKGYARLRNEGSEKVSVRQRRKVKTGASARGRRRKEVGTTGRQRRLFYRGRPPLHGSPSHGGAAGVGVDAARPLTDLKWKKQGMVVC